MPYISAPKDRNQIMLTSYNDLVDEESMARVIDYFVDNLDLAKLGFKNIVPSEEGRPSYPPANMLKLYLYGYRNLIRSSRKLSKSCKVNIEVMWLMDGMQPDFRTISDFRKDNIDSLKNVFHEFTRRITVNQQTGVLSVDGSKFDAWNGKDRNFTITKLDDRIQWLEDHSREYLRLIEIADTQESLAEELAKTERESTLMREEIEEKYREAQERLERYRRYREYMEENNLTQLSLTDPDSRLMKNKDGMEVSFNVQTAIDTENHLMIDYLVTNQATDHGMLASTLSGVKEGLREEIIHGVADKGYQKDEDMVRCLENGIVPHVILPDGEDSYELEIEYAEAECDANSTSGEELKKCLHAGIVPEAYKDYIEDMNVVEVRKAVSDEADKDEKRGNVYGTENEMKEKARDGYFVRDPERDLVYCPGGQTLRRKCIKKSGATRYANKLACAKCPYRGKCFSDKIRWKEIDFSKDCLEKKARWFEKSPKDPEAKPQDGNVTPETKAAETDSSERKNRRHYEKRKVVRFRLKPNRTMMAERMCTSEHPFGTIKQWLSSGFFLLKGLRKTAGEFALFGLAYNMARAENMFTFRELMIKVGG